MPARQVGTQKCFIHSLSSSKATFTDEPDIMALKFDGKTAWFSSIVSKDYITLWVKNGGSVITRDPFDAQYIFSGFTHNPSDMKRIFKSEMFLKGNIAIFAPEIINAVVDENIKSVDIKEYLVLPRKRFSDFNITVPCLLKYKREALDDSVVEDESDSTFTDSVVFTDDDFADEIQENPLENEAEIPLVVQNEKANSSSEKKAKDMDEQERNDESEDEFNDPAPLIKEREDLKAKEENVAPNFEVNVPSLSDIRHIKDIDIPRVTLMEFRSGVNGCKMATVL